MTATVHYDFSESTCVVTGAGRGLGHLTAQRFQNAGAKVAYVSRTPYPEVMAEVERRRERALFLRADVSDEVQVQEAFKKIYDYFGSLEILINNAGIAKAGALEDISSQDWDEVMANNLRSYFLCIRAALSPMKKRRYGRIVNVASVAARDKSLLLGAPYTASKTAVIGLTRQAASEVASYGITVNCVCPSQHWTPMLKNVLTPEMEAALIKKIPLGYIARPEQIADVILFLASDGASYMTGAVVDVNGGLW